MPIVFDLLQMKALAKLAHYLMHHCLQLYLSTQAKGVHAGNTAHGNPKL
jgi:hypothetical protein